MSVPGPLAADAVGGVPVAHSKLCVPGRLSLFTCHHVTDLFKTLQLFLDVLAVNLSPPP